jgi:hypothetical protein
LDDVFCKLIGFSNKLAGLVTLALKKSAPKFGGVDEKMSDDELLLLLLLLLLLFRLSLFCSMLDLQGWQMRTGAVKL